MRGNGERTSWPSSHGSPISYTIKNNERKHYGYRNIRWSRTSSDTELPFQRTISDNYFRDNFQDTRVLKRAFSSSRKHDDGNITLVGQLTKDQVIRDEKKSTNRSWAVSVLLQKLSSNVKGLLTQYQKFAISNNSHVGAFNWQLAWVKSTWLFSQLLQQNVCTVGHWSLIKKGEDVSKCFFYKTSCHPTCESINIFGAKRTYLNMKTNWPQWKFRWRWEPGIWDDYEVRISRTLVLLYTI